MSIYKDKRTGRWRFDFDRRFPGHGRVRKRRLLLRIVTAAQSVWNRVRSNPLGAGVSPNGHGRFVARLQQPGGGEKIYLGTFDTAQEAAAAYIGASVITHGEYAAHKRRMKPRASEKLPTTPPATTAR